MATDCSCRMATGSMRRSHEQTVREAMGATMDDYQTEDRCPHCDRRRHSRYNPKTGAGVVTTWIDCPHRNKCEREIQPGFEPAVLEQGTGN